MSFTASAKEPEGEEVNGAWDFTEGNFTDGEDLGAKPQQYPSLAVQPTSAVRNTLGREQAPQNLVRPVPDEDLREYCDKNYHQILPIIAEKLHQEKVQQEILKAVKTHLNFEKASQYSESETPNRRRNLKEMLGPRGARARSISPEQRRGRSKSPKEKGPERRTVFKRLEKGVFHRLGNKEKNVSAHSIGSERKSYYSSRREAESCYKSSRSKETKIASEKHRYKREYSRRMEAESESEGSAGGNWKSKPKKQKSSMDDDLSQPWVCEETDPFTPRIHYFDFPKTRMPSHIKTYAGSEDPEDHLKIFQAAAKTERWAMPAWCHMFNSTLTRNARRSLGERWRPPIGNGKSHFPPGSKKPDRSKTSRGETSEMNKGEEDGTEGPMIIEAKMGGHCVHRIYVDGGSSSEILYKHCFSKFRPEIKNQLIPANTPLVGFSGEIIWPLGQISLLVKIGDEEHSKSARINFMVVRSPSPYNGIMGRPGVAIHPEHLEQTVAIGSTLIEEGRKELCGLLRRHLDVFAWKPADMTGVPRHIAEHRLNVLEGCLPVRQKKRGQAPERNKAINEEVRKLVEPYKCFLDAYKGYHQIKMADEDEEKTAFITSQGIFCYSKMPFGLKNAGATYQRLVDKAFQKQIGRNLEVYVDDLVIKSQRRGYKLDADGLRLSPDKVKVVMDLPSPKCLKDVQKLNGKLASLNKFLSKPAEKSLPFFKTLKKCTKKSDFQWTREAEKAFKEMKQSIAELPMLTTPKEKEELIIYLAAVKEAISAVLMTERDGKQVPIYFVSRALQGPEVNYTPMEKLILALVSAITGRQLKWRVELGEHDIQYRPRTSVKGQILVDFIVECPEDGTPDTPIKDREELPDPWILFTDRSSFVDGSGAGLIIMNPERMEFPCFKEFSLKKARNVRRKAGRYAVICEVLYKKSFLGPWLRCVSPLQANYVLREIHEVSWSMHAGPRSVVAKALRLGYFCPTMHTDARNLIRQCKDCQVHRPVPKNPQEKLTPITSPWPFYKWGIDIAMPFPKGPDKSSNGETSFSLTYGTKAVIPAETGMPTLRTTEVDVNKNNEALGISLDLLEEKREQDAIQEARSKARMEGYYNARVRSISFRPGDLVYRNNEVSHMEGGGKLGPKWEGPYEVIEALDKGAYKLKDRNGLTLPRTLNIRNLKKCYIHEM
uniref:Reverse transcriptase domain-containing protein n=1 Tax=Tanacetum cinerariifolium TaxID=118510 RepID=A0A6L2M9V1_TANCI|nr:hypothetical protein [Tanacetum cinerariifolium]